MGVRSHLLPITDGTDANSDKESRSAAFSRWGSSAHKPRDRSLRHLSGNKGREVGNCVPSKLCKLNEKTPLYYLSFSLLVGCKRQNVQKGTQCRLIPVCSRKIASLLFETFTGLYCLVCVYVVYISFLSNRALQRRAYAVAGKSMEVKRWNKCKKYILLLASCVS